MKLLMGFIILLVALVAVTGCTQPASTTTPATTAPTTVATAVPTTEVTAAPTTEAMANVTEVPVSNVTAPAANVTTAAPTTVPTANVTANVTATPTAASMVTTVKITATGFVPQTDVVLPGTGISFTNTDNASHSIMAIGSNAGMFNSGAIIPGSAFTYTFSGKNGAFVYQLDNNANITGTIIVQNSPYANPT